MTNAGVQSKGQIVSRAAWAGIGHAAAAAQRASCLLHRQHCPSLSGGQAMGLFAGGGVWMRFAAVTVTYGALARRASAVHTPLAVGLGYCCAVHALVTTLVVADVAPWLIGKNPADGQVPIWSWLVWGPFHLTNRFFVGVAKLNHSRANNLDVATEVWPGWYLGGWYSYELGIHFSAVVDLCCELPERAETDKYMCCANWDGMLHGEDIAQAAPFLAKAAKEVRKRSVLAIYT